MQKITPHLWFDTGAEEAARFYTDLFDDATMGAPSRYDAAAARASGQPEGSVMTVAFELDGTAFLALNGGPHFQPTPAISFFVSCETGERVDQLFDALAEGGHVLMPLQAYPFSPKYAWVEDRFGFSWQLDLAGGPETIAPALMFTGEQHGRAEEAVRFYASLFPDSGVGRIDRFAPGESDPPEDAVKYAELTLHGQPFRAMDGGLMHAFGFNEAISLLVSCDDQAEIDRLWSALTDGGEESQCGWLKDRYGVSWQITPAVLPRLIQDPDRVRAERAMEAMLAMRKLDIGRLQRAFDGE